MKNILFIEDELLLLNAIEAMINAHGFKVLRAHTGEEAINVLNQQQDKIDMIVCDINLPDIDGFAVLKMVRDNYKLYNTPFVFLSAFADEKDVIEGMNAGADDYLTKPFRVNDLLKTINSRLGEKHIPYN